MAVYANNRLKQIVKPRMNVPAGGKAHFVFNYTAPSKRCVVRLKLDLFEHNITFLSTAGAGPITAEIEVR